MDRSAQGQPASLTGLAALPVRPPVTVVIPAWGAPDDLRRAVTSALGQGGIRLVQVVVAADPADAATWGAAAGLVDDDPRVELVDNPGGATPSALNRAIAAARGDVVLRLDAHAQLPDGYAATAVEVLRDTGAVNVGGRQVAVADHGFAAAVAAAMSSPAGSGGATYRAGTQPGPAETVYLGVFRRDALAIVGGFDERLTRNQDFELNHRLRAAGGVVWFDPRLAVTYRPRGTVRGLARQYHDYGRWKRVVLRMHPGSLRLRQLAAPLLVLGLLGAAVYGLITGGWLPLAVAAGLYTIVLVAFAVRAADRPSQVPSVVAAFATMHLSWGVGFFRGAGRRRPRRQPDRHPSRRAHRP